jgi:hypothetical protein
VLPTTIDNARPGRPPGQASLADSQAAPRRSARLPLLLGLALLLACGRPAARPLEGAPPVREDYTPVARSSAPPPTLVAAARAQPAVSLPRPIVAAVASPLASPSPSLGRVPIISGLLPAPDSVVSPGAVTIAARISGDADLSEASLTVDGAPVQPNISRSTLRTWVLSYTARLDIGKHEARLNARDLDERVGGYRWQFDVQVRMPITPAARPTVAPAQPR